MDRAELHLAFASRFHSGKRLRPATAAQLADAESALRVVWPESYHQFALACGAVYSPTLLKIFSASKNRLTAVQQFLTPKQSVTETRRWHLDPDGGCAAFASDSSGSLFAFRQLPTSLPRPEDAIIWLFDHELGEWVEQAISFDEWLGRFLAL